MAVTSSAAKSSGSARSFTNSKPSCRSRRAIARSNNCCTAVVLLCTFGSGAFVVPSGFTTMCTTGRSSVSSFRLIRFSRNEMMCTRTWIGRRGRTAVGRELPGRELSGCPRRTQAWKGSSEKHATRLGRRWRLPGWRSSCDEPGPRIAGCERTAPERQPAPATPRQLRPQSTSGCANVEFECRRSFLVRAGSPVLIGRSASGGKRYGASYFRLLSQVVQPGVQ